VQGRKKLDDLASTSLVLHEVQLGGRSRTGQFVVEADICGAVRKSISRTGQMYLDSAREDLVIRLSSHSSGTLDRIRMPLQSIYGIYVDQAGGRYDKQVDATVLITSLHPVTLEGSISSYIEPFEGLFGFYVDLDDLPPRNIRLSTVPGYEAQSPYILYDFRIRGPGLWDFFSQLASTFQMKEPIRLPLGTSRQVEYIPILLRQLDNRFSKMPLQVAFQAQVSVVIVAYHC
jgi:hypothetical protein